MSEETFSKATPLSGVPIFLCRVPAVASGDVVAVADFLKRVAWVPKFGFTVFGCVHERPCLGVTSADWAAVARLSPDAERLVRQIEGVP